MYIYQINVSKLFKKDFIYTSPQIHYNINLFYNIQELASKTKGEAWFNMAAPEMTPELQDEMRVLRMRRTLNNKQFYKSNDSKSGPKFFQVTTASQILFAGNKYYIVNSCLNLWV